jgi:chromosome segregation ATPase
MSEKKLTQLLEELHKELDSTEAVDEKGRELLRALGADIQELLERSDDSDTDNDSLLERLQESVNHFEATHPALTSAIAHLMTALSNAGI